MNELIKKSLILFLGILNVNVKKMDLEMIKNNIFPGKQTAESRLMTSDFRSELAEK